MKNLSAAESARFLKENEDAVIIDVRTLPEFAQGHIKGAILIDMISLDFQDRIKELDREDKYFVYCRSGARSSSVVELMERLGFTHVFHLEYGLIEWQSEGLFLEK